MILSAWMDLVESVWKGAKFSQDQDGVVATILMGNLTVGCWCESGYEVLDPNTKYAEANLEA